MKIPIDLDILTKDLAALLPTGFLVAWHLRRGQNEQQHAIICDDTYDIDDWHNIEVALERAGFVLEYLGGRDYALSL